MNILIEALRELKKEEAIKEEYVEQYKLKHIYEDTELNYPNCSLLVPSEHIIIALAELTGLTFRQIDEQFDKLFNKHYDYLLESFKDRLK